MLKITRKDISIIIPPYWISTNGFLKHVSICAIKLFFGDYTLGQALKEGKKPIGYSWYTCKGVKLRGGNE